MKKLHSESHASRYKMMACSVSAAALMLGVSSAATIGLHFQCSYGCGANPSYSGYPVTVTAFGVDPAHWENLTEMPSSYGDCSFVAPGYQMEEVIDTTTSTNGLNALPNGSITVNWFANCANFTPFEGYQGIPPQSPKYIYGNGGGFYTNTAGITGEQEIYATFLRDGINYGPNTSGSPAPYGSADNPLQAYYSVDITGLKSLFTNTPFVVELMASADSMNLLTNAFLTDVTNLITNSVTYPNTPPVDVQGDGGLWQRGIGGGMSVASGVFSNTDHLHIASNIPQHGGTGAPPSGFDNAGTISGFIITDKPVVTMSPQSVLAGPQDSVVLSAYAIGVPPLSLQWRQNGNVLAGATTSSFSIASASLTNGGNYDLVVTNLYGAATSKVAAVTVDSIIKTTATGVVFDSNPSGFQKDGVNNGATWLASNSDGTITRTGVMQFNGAATNGITVPGFTNFDSTAGTFTFWMRSAGTVSTDSGGVGAALFGFPTGTAMDDFMLIQLDGLGNLQFQTPPANPTVTFDTSKSVSDDQWHLVALTYDQSANGGAAVFVDGVLDTTNSDGGTPWSIPTGEPLQIGYSTDPTFRAYDGLLSDFRFYDQILTPSQIGSIYNSNAIVSASALQFELNFATQPQQGITLSWQEGTAVLQSAPTVNGPYTDLPGVASPYTIVPAAAQQFFRYRYVPQAVVSNPYLM